MAKRAKDGSLPNDLWKPGELDHMAVKSRLRDIRWSTAQIEKNMRSCNVDIDYGTLMDQVEELYGLLQLDKLAQDNRRRFQEEKERVRKLNG